MMKKCKQWLEELPDEKVRTRALANTGKADGREWATSQSRALFHAFYWHRSPEGFNYWYEVYCRIQEKEKATAV